MYTFVFEYTYLYTYIYMKIYIHILIKSTLHSVAMCATWNPYFSCDSVL